MRNADSPIGILEVEDSEEARRAVIELRMDAKAAEIESDGRS